MPRARLRCSTRTSATRSPPRSSATPAVWPGIAPRRWSCCPPPPASTPSPRSVCCEGCLWPSRLAARTATTARVQPTSWFAACSADAPDNFRHIVPLLEAERAWVLGDFHAAALGFDTARREVSELGRSWHRAVITERAAGFHLAQGLEHAGRDLMTEACRHYVAWGATAKVAQMDRAGLPPEAPPAGPAQRRSTVTSGTIDLLGVLSASQAL